MYNYATEERVAGAPTGSVVFVSTVIINNLIVLLIWFSVNEY